MRPEAETLVRELINVYRASGEDEREAVRKLFEEYRAFAWAASLPFEPTTEENFAHMSSFHKILRNATAGMPDALSTYAEGPKPLEVHHNRSHSIQ